jgi:Ca2+-binding EF-hand superfamily protein
MQRIAPHYAPHRSISSPTRARMAKKSKQKNKSKKGLSSPAKARLRLIVNDKTLLKAFELVDDGSTGTIIVGDFLNRLREDEEMTDELQDGTNDFVTPEMLDEVFDSLGRNATKVVTAKEFLELFMLATPDSAPASPEVEIRTTRPVDATDARTKDSMTSTPDGPMVDKSYLRRVFELIDYDGNGEVTLVEFLGALHSNPEIGVLLDQGTMTGRDVANDVADVFSRMDADQNKSVSFDEFVKYFTVQQGANKGHSLNTLSQEEKERLLMSADKDRIRSMSALKRGVRFISKQALKAGLRKSTKERLEENLSKMDDSELLVLKSYLRDIFKLVDYQKRERILLQEFLDELAQNPYISVALDVGNNSDSNPETTKKMVEIIFQALAIDSRAVVEFPEFVNYFLKINSEHFNEHSPLAKDSWRSKTRTKEQNQEMLLLVVELFKIQNGNAPVQKSAAEPPKTAASALEVVKTAAFERDDELAYADELKSASQADNAVSLLQEQIKKLSMENQMQKKANNALKLKLNVLTHMYSVQSAEFQALIDATT